MCVCVCVCLLLDLYYGCRHAGVSVAVSSYRPYVYSSCATLIPACGFIVIACVRAFMLARGFIRNRPTGSLRIQQNIPCLHARMHAGIRLLKLQRQVAPSLVPHKISFQVDYPTWVLCRISACVFPENPACNTGSTQCHIHLHAIIIHVSAYRESE